MQQQLRVDTGGVQAMASHWGQSADELSETTAPAGLGLSCQASVTAVNAAHADVTAFAATLATRVGVRATRVAEADTRYIATEASSGEELAAVADPVICG
jgi:hypothetical protein